MEAFPSVIAAAMRAEWGSSPSARKEIARITNANERAVRNWFEGQNGPSGENLVLLIRHSDAVFESVLMMTGRNQALTLLKAQALRSPLKALLDHLDQALKEELERPI